MPSDSQACGHRWDTRLSAALTLWTQASSGTLAAS
eukprot:CAMPEP_0203989376 /NCGR_PEP_ID=MMETSP0360-20130528/8082_1 /ASSEMBLY_ACC=CAM_ASM_000342 /TAXON_ID=268821 /ORGANISM="Scrippsiella Hangoei, Strain SHTV-5" /LENGTH=34 /DNA_ID= /DNA_START= /DNA_END= /DNA_ORIENTATION=